MTTSGAKDRFRGRPTKAGHAAGAVLRLYGRHAVVAALANPRRKAIRLCALERAAGALRRDGLLPDNVPVEVLAPGAFAALLPADAVAQGLVLEVAPLPPCALEDLAPREGVRSLVVVLDQVEDPHNVGAIMRSAAAFGALALVTQDRHAPAESGVLAKAASGALDILPWVRVSNLAMALERLAGLGYWRIGLAGTARESLGATVPGEALALVLGAEGKGLRPLTEKHCDLLARIPMRPASPLIDSLNVSNAAAVALYCLSEKGPDL